MRKLYELFKILQVQKRIVSTETIRRNIFSVSHFFLFVCFPAVYNILLGPTQIHFRRLQVKLCCLKILKENVSITCTQHVIMSGMGKFTTISVEKQFSRENKSNKWRRFNFSQSWDLEPRAKGQSPQRSEGPH